MATIQIADNDARVQYTQAVVANTTQLTIDFPFFDLDDINVIITSEAGVDTTLSRGTGTGTFAVTGTAVDDGFSGGHVTLGDSYASASTKYTIFRDIPVSRTTDFPTSGPFNISSLNTELDKIFAVEQELETKITRTMRLADSDTAADLALPNLDTRKGTVLAFNSTTGLPEAGPEIADISTIQAITADIATLADIEDGTDATDTIQTVAGIASNVSTVAGVSADVTTVAGQTTNMQNITDNLSDVQNAATNATNAAASASAASTSETNAATSESNSASSATSSSNSATASASSASASAASASAASTSESNASTSETNAASSASSASTSASTATTQAGIATTKAGEASTSATNAATSETNAATSESNAASSATNAAASEANASTSETNAASSETSAASSATSAASSATSASTSETNAAASEANASASETNAANSEANAATSASNAATSETNAASSASSASSAQTAAESARDATLAAYDNFDDRYLGTKSSAPTLDNDGNALVAGALYFDSTAEAMYVYTGSAWVAAYVSGTGFLALTGGTMTGDINFGDNDKATFGAGDLQVYHDGTASRINDVGTGNLLISTNGDSIRLLGNNATEIMGRFNSNGSAQLYYDNSLKLSTTSGGIDVTGTVTMDGATTSGNIDFGDSDRARFGAGSDLQIFHNGNNSYIDESGTGILFIRSNQVKLQKYTGEDLADFVADGAVTLYHDNAAKLATTSTGVSVTGTVTATAFSGDGSGLTGIAGFPSGTLMLFQQTAAPTGWTKQTTHNDKALRVVTGSAGSGGSVAFSTAMATPSVSGSVSISGSISNTTLSTSQMPSHTHTANRGGGGSGTGGNAAVNGTYNTGSTGGGGSHNHGHSLSGSLSSSTATINVNYVDLIIAAKD